MKKILIVDDDPTSRLILHRAVHDEGYAAVCASNAKLAREILSENPDFSALITDMVMPGQSGRDLIADIRSQAWFTNLPIVMVSGIVRLSEISDILEAGASRFFPKPINIRQLREYLRTLSQTMAVRRCAEAQAVPK